MNRLSASLVTTALLVASATTFAQPWTGAPVSDGAYLSNIAHARGDRLVVAANAIDTSTIFTPFRGRVYVSSDGGASFTDASGALANQPAQAPLAGVAGLGPDHIWVSRATDVLHSADGGETWTSTSAPGELNALHFFDTSKGVGVGADGVVAATLDGGASWTAVPSGTDVELRGMFWLDAQQGWAWGHDERTEGGFGQEEATVIDQGVLVATTDKGASWTPVATFEGVEVGPAFFLADARTGWIALATRADPQGRDADAALQQTLDGGATWGDVELPTEVGFVRAPFGGEEPIGTSYIRAMHWESSRYGHLVAAAHLWDAEVSDSGGSSSTTRDASGWRIIDYTTEDGGSTWAFTDLGQVDVEFSLEGPQGESDGFIAAGILRDQYRGWLVSWNGSVYRHESGCGAPPTCRGGYGCFGGVCSAPAGGVDQSGAVPAGDSTGDDATASEVEAGDRADRRPPGLDGPAGVGGDGRGCTVTRGHPSSGWVASALLIVGWPWRRAARQVV